ncbi:uncharacterized protein LY89DRAFT_666420 [Mollisia scopiformis]|uniref:Uncharacterized protein n=1 Tax=Mollisia scopiformis TaxID=149040 RepID=A0A194XKS9_MOLSC|nr:uncharacterized protein LY89DRAFT_666420 [Mollisia scopiformis]KUJ20783.1 hypothetical protein LY89DRAFT_666420 [Mollisia scopiformis]
MPTLNSLLTIAILFFLLPLNTLALPTDSLATAIDILSARSDNDLLSRQTDDGTGQIACIPTDNLHACQLRSTQFPNKDAVITVFDPWCNKVGVAVTTVQTVMDQYVAVPILDWADVVEVTWWIPLWSWSPSGVYQGMKFGQNGQTDLNQNIGCDEGVVDEFLAGGVVDYGFGGTLVSDRLIRCIISWRSQALLRENAGWRPQGQFMHGI